MEPNVDQIGPLTSLGETDFFDVPPVAYENAWENRLREDVNWIWTTWTEHTVLPIDTVVSNLHELHPEWDVAHLRVACIAYAKPAKKVSLEAFYRLYTNLTLEDPDQDCPSTAVFLERLFLFLNSSGIVEGTNRRVKGWTLLRPMGVRIGALRVSMMLPAASVKLSPDGRYVTKARRPLLKRELFVPFLCKNQRQR
jgi:hypothetical protein